MHVNVLQVCPVDMTTIWMAVQIINLYLDWKQQVYMCSGIEGVHVVEDSYTDSRYACTGEIVPYKKYKKMKWLAVSTNFLHRWSFELLNTCSANCKTC